METKGNFVHPWQGGTKIHLKSFSLSIRTLKTAYEEVFQNYMGVAHKQGGATPIEGYGRKS